MKNAVQILEGAQAIKDVYTQSLQAKRVDFVCLSKNFDSTLEGWWSERYAKELYDGARQTRELVLDTADNRQAADEAGSTHQVRVLTKIPCEGDMILAEDWVALVSYGEEPYAVVHRDAAMVAYLKEMFEQLWQARA